jgi:hypothetical protein
VAATDPTPGTVVSIVYDGSPEAGKTTSVMALGQSLGAQVYSPEANGGRTPYFDWLEHVGGRFLGAPIRCQVASVPGQLRWRRRRAVLLDRADAVVLVADTRRSAWPATLARLTELRRALDARPGPAVGVVLQANQRDRHDAIPLDELRRAVADPQLAVIESIASSGIGVREAFVFAVRLALDRLRGLDLSTRAEPEATVLGRPDEVLALLRQLQLDDDPAPAPAVDAAAPQPPWDGIPSGYVWPPIEGRVILAAIAGRDRQPTRDVDGHWTVDLAEGWRAHSWADASFAGLDLARAALLRWARQHAAAQDLLSRRRCIALVATGAGDWRLWQVIAREPIAARIEPPGVDGSALAAAMRLGAELGLPQPDAFGWSPVDGARYIGLMPPPSVPSP